MMIAKLHKINNKKILAVCDKNIMGKKFFESRLQLDLTSDFYNGEEKNEEELAKMLDDVDFINFVGKKAVEFGIKKGLVERKNVIFIKKIPHAQVI